MVKNLVKTPLGRFRVIAFLEGLSYILILFVTMPLKYQFDMPKPNLIIGMIHGILFMVYLYTAFRLKYSMDWNTRLTIKTFMASIIPFGTFYMDWKVFRHL